MDYRQFAKSEELRVKNEGLIITRNKNVSDKTVAIGTLGCKVNQYESAFLEEMFLQAGYQMVPFTERAHVYIVNTCTVTQRVDYQCRQLIRRAHQKNPSALIVVTGCYAQSSPDVVASLPGVELIVGNQAKPDLLRLLEESVAGSRLIFLDSLDGEQKIRDPVLTVFRHRTRAFLKIEDGCSAACTYCIVPKVRGKSRSLPPDDVIERLGVLVKSGHREIVLTGVHLGAYGLDLHPPSDILSLLRSIEEKASVKRLRLSSIEPQEVSREMIRFISSSAVICPHLHIPLQSGDDEILKRMNRPYRRQDFQQVIEDLVSRLPSVCIGVDVIAGFPGEDDENFDHTLHFLDSLPLAYFHVFPYSRRKGTEAASFPDQVDPRVIRSRAEILRQLSARKRETYYRRFVGENLSVLVEGKKDPSDCYYEGLSRNYIPVLVEGTEDLLNEEVEVQVVRVEGEKVYGKLINLAKAGDLC
jgi:threonylcarbamoyladenosine tRNA methylthiotransferase MtaB